MEDDIKVNDKSLQNYLNEKKGEEAGEVARETVSEKSFEVARSRSSRVKRYVRDTNRVISTKTYKGEDIKMYEFENEPYAKMVENVIHVLKIGEEKTTKEIADVLSKIRKKAVNKTLIQSYMMRFRVSPLGKYLIRTNSTRIRGFCYRISDEGREISTPDLYKLFRSGGPKSRKLQTKSNDVNKQLVSGNEMFLFEIVDKSTIRVDNISIKILDGVKVRFEISKDLVTKLFIEQGGE